MTGKPALKSARRSAACSGVRRYSPSASCWCSGDPSPNPKKRRCPCVGVSPPRPSARRLKVKRSARPANPARPRPRRPRQGAGGLRNVLQPACRSAHSVPPVQEHLPVSEPVHAVAARALGPLARPPAQAQAAGQPRREAKRPLGPLQAGFARPRAESPAVRSIRRLGPSRESRRRGAVPLEVAHFEHFVAAQSPGRLHFSGIALELADQGTRDRA